jgi:hypothetical protein
MPRANHCVEISKRHKREYQHWEPFFQVKSRESNYWNNSEKSKLLLHSNRRADYHEENIGCHDESDCTHRNRVTDNGTKLTDFDRTRLTCCFPSRFNTS